MEEILLYWLISSSIYDTLIDLDDTEFLRSVTVQSSIWENRDKKGSL